MIGSRGLANLVRPEPEATKIVMPAGEAMNEEEPPVKKRSKFAEVFSSILTGNILSRSEVRKAYPYMIFVAILMFIYIGNAFRSQQLYREQAQLTEQVRELRSKSMSIASEKMQATRQTTIMKELERRGIPLRESLTPNKVIPKQTDGGR